MAIAQLVVASISEQALRIEGVCIVCDGIICLQLKMDEVAVREKVDNLHSKCAGRYSVWKGDKIAYVM